LRPSRLWGAAVAALLVLALAALGCGSPDELSREDDRALATAREGLDDAIDTEETLRTSGARAARLRRQVRRIVSRGAFESGQLDEFGLASLGELGLAVPSLVVLDADGSPARLDRRATRAFLRHAESNPRRALFAAADRHVRTIERVVDESDPGPDTRVDIGTGPAAGDETVDAYLLSAEDDVAPIWPSLAGRLRELREDL
jgi:hypothetical protein